MALSRSFSMSTGSSMPSIVSDRVIAALGDRIYPFGLHLGAGELTARLALRCGRLIALGADAATRRRLAGVANLDARPGWELPSWRFDLVVCSDWSLPLEAVEAVMPRAATLLAIDAPGDLARSRPSLVRILRDGPVERFERR